MKNEMKKNNKMLLALVVVAALAMVSVAAVVSDGADAANRNDQMVGGTTILTSDDSNLNATFFILPDQERGIQSVTITDGVTISGTIAVGTADNRNGDNYVEYASVTLSGVSNAVFTLMLVPNEAGELVGIIMVGDAAKVDLKAATPDLVITDYKPTTGTFEVTQGTLIAGAIRAEFVKTELIDTGAFDAFIPGENLGSKIYGAILNPTNTDPAAAFPGIDAIVGGIAPLTGTILAGDAEVSVASIYGMCVGIVDDRAVVYGETVKNAIYLPWVEELVPQDDEPIVGAALATPEDESQVYAEEGIPALAYLSGGTSWTIPTKYVWADQAEPEYAYIPADAFTNANVTFVSGEISVGLPEGFVGFNGAYGDGNYFALVNIDGVVEEAATLIIGDNMPKMATSVVITVDVKDSSGNVQIDPTTSIFFLVPEKGSMVGMAACDYDPIDPTKVLVTFNNVMLNAPYKLVGEMDGGAFIADFSVDGDGIDYSVYVGYNELAGDDPIVTGSTGLGYDGTNVTFDSATYAYVAFAATSNTSFDKAKWITDLVEFETDTGTVPVEAGDYFLAVLVDQLGNSQLYVGYADATMPGNLASNTNLSAALFNEEEYTLESVVTTFELLTKYDILAGAEYADNYTFLIKGTVDSIFTNYKKSNIYGDIWGKYNGQNSYTGDDVVYNVNVDGVGEIIYGVKPVNKPTSHPLVPAKLPNLNAVYYVENDFPDSTTYHYTTLANALDNSNNVTVVGWIFILEDDTLVGPDANADTNISISMNSGLVIGWREDPDLLAEIPDHVSTPVEEANAKVQVPEKTTVTKVGNAVYWVAFGQAIYDVKPTKQVNTPTAEVLLEGEKYIYTDLWTALDITVSGDTIKLLKNATLTKDGTLKAGVTFIDAPWNLTIAEKINFIVNGTVNSTKSMKIIGTLTVNGVANFNGGATAIFDKTPPTTKSIGAINVTKDGVLNVGGDGKVARITGAVGEGTITIEGTMNVSGTTAMVTAGTIHIIGTVNNTKGTVAALDTLIVGKIPTLSKGYVNSAVIEGNRMTLGTGAKAVVFGEFEIDLGTVLKTEYMIDDVLYATVYTAASTMVIPTLWDDPDQYVDDLLDIKINDWNNNKVPERGLWLSENPTKTVGEDGWKVVYADWEPRTYKVTFANAAGVNWDAHATDGSWSNTKDTSGTITGSGTFDIAYGTELVVLAYAAAGYSGTPTVKLNGQAFANGGKFTVTGPGSALFESSALGTTGGDGDTGTGGDDGGMSLTEILLIVIVVVIVIMAILVAIRLLRS